MPQVIAPTMVTTTKDGECRVHIILELNININQNGETTASVISAKEEKKAFTQLSDKVEYEIPDFSSGNFIDFGKNK